MTELESVCSYLQADHTDGVNTNANSASFIIFYRGGGFVCLVSKGRSFSLFYVVLHVSKNGSNKFDWPGNNSKQVIFNMYAIGIGKVNLMLYIVL